MRRIRDGTSTAAAKALLVGGRCVNDWCLEYPYEVLSLNQAKILSIDQQARHIGGTTDFSASAAMTQFKRSGGKKKLEPDASA